MKKNLLVSLILVSLASLSAKAQNVSDSYGYTTGLGVKLWNDGAGVSFKQFTESNRAIEAIGYFWNGGARITGLYEFHFDIAGAPGLKWYVGPGVHVGFYNDRSYNSRYYRNNYDDGSASGSFAGIDGVLGLDYKFNGVPLNLSLDWQPTFEFGDNRGFIGSWGGLGVRYTFN
jgi:hypothetical protein